eukprot:jgi/Bigna1/88057/estExt_fgenesh1_pg.C_270166
MEAEDSHESERIDWCSREKKYHQDRILRHITKVTTEFRNQERVLIAKMRELGKLRQMLAGDGGRTLLPVEVHDDLIAICKRLEKNRSIHLDMEDDIDEVFTTTEIFLGEQDGMGELEAHSALEGYKQSQRTRQKALEAKENAKDAKRKLEEDQQFKEKMPKYFFKECAVIGNRYFSIADGKTEYKGGVEVKIDGASDVRQFSQFFPHSGGEVTSLRRPDKDLIEIKPHENLHLLAHCVFTSEERARMQPLPRNSALLNTPRAILKFVTGGKYHWYEDDAMFWFEKIKPVQLKRWYTSQEESA